VVVAWLEEAPEATFREIEGSVAFVDISGFTQLSERLAKGGKVGAEVLTEALDSSFTELLSVAYDKGGSLLKFGGDALLLLFTGLDHELRACRAAIGMRRTLRSIGRVTSSGRPTTLRMSVGIHSGPFQFFLVGDAHKELIITGPAATRTVAMESLAAAGEILLSESTASAVTPSVLGSAKGPGVLLRSEPRAARDEELVLTTKEVDADLSIAVPVSLRDHLLAEGHEPEHRQVTVAFVQFEGTDELLESEGSDAVAAALGELVGAAEAASERQEVSFLATDVAKDGGKIILVAGAPKAAGDDDERMLLAVRELVDAGLRLPLRIGINRGHVFAGDVGPWYRRTYTIMGDAVNLAARLMAAAAPGQILTTEGVVQRSRTRFAATALPPLSVKGKARPVNPCDVGPVIETAPRRHREATLPLVGRDRELAVLLDAVQQARDGLGLLVDLVGEPGMGTSRLVGEVTARAADAFVISAECDRYGSNIPYYPFRRLLREVLGLGRDDDDTLALTRLLERTQGAAPDLVSWLPLLGIVLDIDLAATPETAALEEQFLHDRIADVTTRFLAAVLPSPSLIVLQDVHWMDDASSGLLRRLTADVDTRSWLVVTTRRQADTGFVPEEGPSCTRIEVGPLSIDAAVAMLEMLTEDEPLPHHEIVAAASRSGGNPLFLAELLSALRAGGGAETLPDTVEAMITTKVDQLPPKDRSLLRHAAVLGIEFDEGLLRSVVDEILAPEMSTAWDRLAEFVAPNGAGMLRFHNALVRDVAYEGLPYRRRRQLHARVGETLLKGRDRAAEEHTELLALHFYFGQRFDDALRFSRSAGDRARSKYANLDAAKFYERAIDSARRVPEASEGDLVDLWESLGDVRHRAGELKKAHDAYTAARRLLSGDPVREARLLLKEAQISDLVGRASDALRWIRRGQRALEGIEGREAARQRAQLRVWYAVVRQAQGRAAEAIKWCHHAIAEAQAAGDRDALAHAYYTLDWALVTQGRSDGNRYSWQALAIYEELGDLIGQATVLNNLGAWAYFEGRWRDARDLYERARSAHERAGDPVSAAYGLVNVGEILSDQGRVGEAEPLFRQSIRVFKASGYRYGLAFAESQLARVAARSGRFDEALTLFDGAGAAFLSFGDRIAVVDTNARVAESMLLRDDPEAAFHTADDALATAEALDRVDANVPSVQRIRGLALMRLGRLEPARSALEQSLEVARRRKAEYEVALTLRALAQLGVLEGEDPAALWEESDEILDRLGVEWVPEIPGLPELPRRGDEAAAADAGPTVVGAPKQGTGGGPNGPPPVSDARTDGT
jgi:class 3 adenylate cyclase/tetratricopeptide (TPR) repeat protein